MGIRKQKLRVRFVREKLAIIHHLDPEATYTVKWISGVGSLATWSLVEKPGIWFPASEFVMVDH